MLKTRVIPTLLWKDLGLVKGKSFDSWRRVDSVLPAIKIYCMRDVDELILLDVAATLNGRSLDYESVAEFSEECFVPLTVGGGLRSIEQVKEVLRSGADKVAINSAAYDDIVFVSRVADRFGTQCVVASVDVRLIDGAYRCYSHAGNQARDVDPVNWARQLEKAGAGEILLTSIERDGTMEGYDLNLIRMVSDAVGIPVIASGGARDYEDFLRAITDGGASAVAAASIYHWTHQTPGEAKRFLHEHGIPVRLAASGVSLSQKT